MTLADNPVLGREFRLLLRDPKLLRRLLFGWVALAALMLVFWPSSGMYSSEAQGSRFVFKAFAFGQLALMLLLAPSITAPLITEEKEKERFGMLFASLLTPMDILVGKWLGSFAVLVLVLLSGVPLLVLTLALGGVSLVEVVQVYLILLLTLLEFGFLGLLLSCLKNRTYAALLSSYGWMLVIVAATWLPSYLLAGFQGLALPFLLLRSLSPFSAMMDVVAPEYLIVLDRLPREWRISELWTPDLLSFVLGALSLSVVFFLVCWRKVLLLPLGRDVTSEIKEETAKKKRFPYYLLNPDRRRSPFSVGRLVFTKELRCKLFGYLGNLIRGIYIGLGVSMCLVILVCLNVRTLSADGTLDQVRLVAVLFQLAVILLMTPALTASTVAEEHVSGTLEMLRLSPLTPWQFFRGKLLAGLLYMAILLASSCPIYGLILTMEIMLDGDPWIVARVVAAQGCFLVCCAVTGLWASAFTLNTQKATGLAYTMLVLLVGLPFALPSLLDAGPLLDGLLAASPFLVCIREASRSAFRGHEVFAASFFWSGAVILLLAGHALFLIRGQMRRAA